MKRRRGRWSTRSRTPSRHEEGHEPAVVLEIVAESEDLIAAPVIGGDIHGGPVRGRVLHKLIEEVLTGETMEGDLEARAAELIGELAAEDAVDAGEAAGTVRRTLALPEVAALRPRLVAEADLASVSQGAGGETMTVGIADALAVDPDGRIDAVIDWKSDVAPAPATLKGYRQQMADYLTAVGADRGLLVLMTEGRVIEVAMAHAEPA